MKKAEGLLESPQIVGDDDFGLNDRTINAERAALLTSYDPTVIERFDSADLVHVGGSFGGQLGLINRRTKRLEYFMHYDLTNIARLGLCATQIKLWRGAYASVEGITVKAFDGFLLDRFDSVVSDTQQTQDGRKFWQRKLGGSASTKTIGTLFRGTIKVYDKATPVDDWVNSANGWGRANSYRYLRFFISNLAVEPTDDQPGRG